MTISINHMAVVQNPVPLVTVVFGRFTDTLYFQYFEGSKGLQQAQSSSGSTHRQTAISGECPVIQWIGLVRTPLKIAG